MAMMTMTAPRMMSMEAIRDVDAGAAAMLVLIWKNPGDLR